MEGMRITAVNICKFRKYTTKLGRSPRKIARMTFTAKLDGNWSSFQLANSASPLSVTDSAIAPSARMGFNSAERT